LGAPLIWLGVHPVIVHNLLVLVSFVASGLGMYVLAKSLTGSALAAGLGGLVFAFQPYRFAHYPQLELLWGWWIPLALWAFHRLLYAGRLRDGVLMGVFVSLQVLSCLYYAVFLVTALAILAPVLLFRRSRTEWLRLVRPTAAAVLVCVALAGPYVVPYVQSAQTVGTRREQDIRDWSPPLRSYVANLPQNWIYGSWTGQYGYMEGTLFPGLTATLLAVAGVWRPARPHTFAYLVLLLVTFDLSLGFNGLMYRTAYDLMLPYKGLRVPARLFVVVCAALTVLSVEGFRRLMARLPTGRARAAVAWSAIGLVMLESASVPIALEPVPRHPPRVYEWLAQQPPAIVMEWPQPRAFSLGVTHEPLYMYYSIFHWHRLVNGYSGYYPPSYVQFVETVYRLPRSSAIRHMQKIGVRYLILHSEFAPDQYRDVRDALIASPQLELLFVDRENSAEISVFRVAPRRPD
jgi:hypothetical protein